MSIQNWWGWDRAKDPDRTVNDPFPALYTDEIAQDPVGSVLCPFATPLHPDYVSAIDPPDDTDCTLEEWEAKVAQLLAEMGREEESTPP